MEAKLNQFAKVDDFERALILAQYAHENGFRAGSALEFYQFFKSKLDLTGLSNTAGLPEEFPEPNATLEATNAQEWTVLGPGKYNKIVSGEIDIADDEFAFAQFDGSDFNRVVRVKVPMSPTADTVEEGNNLPPKSDAVYKAVRNVANRIDARISGIYNVNFPLRAYSSNDDYVTVVSTVSQQNTDDYDILTRNVTGTSTLAVYFNTPVLSAVKEDTAICIEGRLLDIIGTGSVAFGFGWGKLGSEDEDDVFRGIAYRSSDTYNGEIISLTPFINTARHSDLPKLKIGDVVRFNIYINGNNFNQQRIDVYLNEAFITTLDYPYAILLDANFQLVLRGGLSVHFNKIFELKEKFAPFDTVKEVEGIKQVVNVKHPFKSDATFFRDGSTSGPVPWMSEFLVDIKLFGFPVTDRISLFLIRRNSSHASKYALDFYRDTGTGNGSSAARELVMSWSNPQFVEPATGQISVIEHTQGNLGFKAYIDWSKAPVGDTGSITFNACGLAKEVYINFNSSSILPQPTGNTRLLWQYSTVDAPTTGTKLFKKYTVLADVDEDNLKIACTGACYNTKKKVFAISYFAQARRSLIYEYERKDLTDYSPEGDIKPMPTKIIDVSAYLYNLQGLAYDEELDCYWMLGSDNPVGVGDARRLVRIDMEGYLQESHSLSAYNFEPGMLAMSPDQKNLLIKPNNRSQLWEINKTTKEMVRQVNVFTGHEGLGVSKDGFVWIAGNSGLLRKHNYADMSVIYTVPFETLVAEDGVSQNVEGIVYDPIDGALCFVYDAFYHGGHKNGNRMDVFDFESSIGKSIRFPEMMPLVNGRSPVIDFSGFESIQKAIIVEGSGTIMYRGSNDVPTRQMIERNNWRDLPYYTEWGQTEPTEWTTEIPNSRYIQLGIF